MFLISLVLFFFAIVIHEYAHGWVAYKLGDPTAKYAGRLTLNPLAHIDPFGTIILPVLLAFSHSPVIFGWAKPVPIDFYRLGNPRKGVILVGLAGPAANIIMAFVLAAFLKLNFSLGDFFIYLLKTAAVLNLFLAVFNLIPIPPLDGSRVLMGLLPYGLSHIYARSERYGFIILFVLLYLGMIGRVVAPIVEALAKVLGI